jgi:hypothetical protein
MQVWTVASGKAVVIAHQGQQPQKKIGHSPDSKGFPTTPARQKSLSNSRSPSIFSDGWALQNTPDNRGKLLAYPTMKLPAQVLPIMCRVIRDISSLRLILKFARIRSDLHNTDNLASYFLDHCAIYKKWVSKYRTPSLGIVWLVICNPD